MLHHTLGKSPVAYADCKLTGQEEGPLCVDVLFRSKEDLDDFITSLKLLRDATDFDHSHLQDKDMKTSGSIASTEMVFHFADSCVDSTRDELILGAEKRLAREEV